MIRNLRWLGGLALCVLAVGSSATRAEPIIVVGDHPLLPNQSGQLVPIYVSGGDAVEGLNLNVQIGDGGPPLGGTTVAPLITAVDFITGTIFDGNNNGQSDITVFPLFYAGSTTTSKATVNADGLLATLTIDTTGFFFGSWALQLGNTKNGPTDFTLVGAAITDGLISVPEPSGLMLALATMLPLVLACRRASSRRRYRR
jgi:hypothetical protein